MAFATMLEGFARDCGVWRPRSVPAGAHVFEPKSDLTPLCVLTAGLVKLYYSVADGDEWTKSYIVDCGVFGPSSPGVSVALFGARALEDCKIGTIDMTWLARQLSDNKNLSDALATFQAWLFERKRQREEDLLCLSAEARYLAFTERNPILASRLQQQEIATYLRITPVALSRIRRRLRLQGLLPAASPSG